MNLISVIVPVYNAERFLKECIESIVSQTYSNIELILIDDGSTDNSPFICRQFEKSDPRVRYIQHRQSGVSSARNIGLREANGNYICFIDSDDCIEADYIEVLYNKICEEKVDVVFCNYKLLYGNKCLEKKPRLSNRKYTFNDIANVAVDDGTITGILFGSVCMAIYNANMIRQNNLCFDETIKRNEDGLFNLCALQKANSFFVLDYDGYIYRQWKKIQNPNFEFDIELDKATERIRDCCANISELDKQLKCRKVSVVFWNAIKIECVQGSFIDIVKELKEYLKNHSIKEECRCLNYNKLNSQKRMLIDMLKKKQVLRFVLIMKYVYPVLKRFVKR